MRGKGRYLCFFVEGSRLPKRGSDFQNHHYKKTSLRILKAQVGNIAWYEPFLDPVLADKDSTLQTDLDSVSGFW